MIKIQGKIPHDVGVAVSGGVDSMAILDFLSRKNTVTAYYFNHGTEYGNHVVNVIKEFCDSKNISLQIGHISSSRPKNKSAEEHWRDERYNWLRAQPREIVLGHHLDDCVETYLFNMCNGKNYTIPYRHANCIRPFRLSLKKDFVNWAIKHSIPFVDDPSNNDTKYNRNKIRHVLIPIVKSVNPGINKVLYKIIKEEIIQ
jgi:tRNA(Ile)-lysidine synthase